MSVFSKLSYRKKESNKYDYGHVLIIAGSRGMAGAGVLAARAALRTGIGLVTVGSISSAWKAMLNAVPEAMALPLKESRNGIITGNNYKKVVEYILSRKVNAVAVGPGLRTARGSQMFVTNILKSKQIGSMPLVIDADGINVLPVGLKYLASREGVSVITPHLGEYQRLTGEQKLDTRTVEQHAKLFAREHKIVCVIKKNKTFVTDGMRVYRNTTGNPGMATAGAGDVLTGIITAMLSMAAGVSVSNKVLTGNDVFDIVTSAVYLHGMAGDIAAGKLTQNSVTASDIVESIPLAWKRV